MATVEEYHAFFETLWKDARMDEAEARRALRQWVEANDFTLYDMGLTVYEYHEEEEDGEEEYTPEQWAVEKARREALRIYEQHVGLLRDYIALEHGRKRWESDKDSMSHPAQRLVRAGYRENPRDWEARWEEAWKKVGGEGASREDMVALNDSPIWAALSVFGLPYPPFDYDSGMVFESVDYDEAVELGLLEPPDNGLSDEQAEELEKWFKSI